MSTSIPADQSYVEQVSIAPPAPGTVGEEQEEKFDTVKAVNYNVANLGASVFYGLFNFAMPLYLMTYNLHPSIMGLLANERSFIGAFVQPIVGRISDRTRSPLGRRRPFFVIGIPLVCAGLFGLALHPPLWQMILIMSVLAFFLSVAWDPYMALMADLFASHHRGRVGGLIGVGTGLGNIILAIVAMTMWGNNEFGVFMLVIGIMILTWTYTFITVKEPPLPAKAELPTRQKTKFDPAAYIRGLRQHPEAAKYTFAVLFYWLGTGGVIPFITPFGVKALGATEAQSFILPLAATVASAITAVPLGILADRTSKKLVMSGSMIAFGLIALIGSQSQSLVQGTIVLALCGACIAGMSQINPMLSDLVPRSRMAEFIGLSSSVFSFAQPLGSVVAGGVVWIASRFLPENDAYRWAFIAAGALLILSATLLQTVHPERAKSEE
jgi:MFS family permease